MITSLLTALIIFPQIFAYGQGFPGALYILSNNDEQEIVVSALGADGKASFANRFKTGGMGAGDRLDDATKGMDPLESQNGLLVAGQYLFAVNSGSNDISMFVIDQYDPTTLVKVGGNTPSGGDYPVSIAVNPDRNLACVINSGPKDGLQCFYLGISGLYPIPNSYFPFNLNQTSPPVGPPNTPSDVIFSRDGKQLYVSVKGNGTVTGPQGYIEAFSVEDYNIKKIGRAEPQRGGLAFSMTLFPDSNTIFVTDPASGADFVQFDSSGATAVAQSFKIPGQAASCWSAYSEVTSLFYVSDTAVATLTSVYANSSSLSSARVISTHNVTNAAGKPAATLDVSIAKFNTAQEYLYLHVPSDQTIRVFSLTPRGSKWDQIQDFEIGRIVNGTAGAKLGVPMAGSAIYMKAGSW